jgi:hypothetical protein
MPYFRKILNPAAGISIIMLSMFGCTQPIRHNKFDSGLFVVSTTAKSTGVTVCDSLYVDRYSNDSIYFFDLELFGHLYDGKVDISKQIKPVPFSADYQCSGVISVLSPDSLYGYIELQSENNRDTLILQFKRLSNRGSGQKFIKEGDNKIKRVLSYKNVDTATQRFVVMHEALLIVEGNKLSAYVGVHSQGSVVYFLKGIKVDDLFVGEYVTLNSKNPNRSDSTIGDFKLKILNDYIELTGYFPFLFENRIKRTDDFLGFNYEASSMFARPSLKSNALLSSSELVNKCLKGCEILEIYQSEKAQKEQNLWYRVSTGGKVGWVFGGIQFHHDSSF